MRVAPSHRLMAWTEQKGGKKKGKRLPLFPFSSSWQLWYKLGRPTVLSLHDELNPLKLEAKINTSSFHLFLLCTGCQRLEVTSTLVYPCRPCEGETKGPEVRFLDDTAHSGPNPFQRLAGRKSRQCHDSLVKDHWTLPGSFLTLWNSWACLGLSGD